MDSGADDRPRGRLAWADRACCGTPQAAPRARRSAGACDRQLPARQRRVDARRPRRSRPVTSTSRGVEPPLFRQLLGRFATGVTVIDGTVAHIECAQHAAVPGGDHTIFIGLVVGGDATDQRPLLYYRGGYAGLSL